MEVIGLDKLYPLSIYTGDAGGIEVLTDDFIEVDCLDDTGRISEKDLDELRDRYNPSKVYMGYGLFMGNPGLSIDKEFILDSFCHPLFLLEIEGQKKLYNVISYRNKYYLTSSDMYISNDNMDYLLEKGRIVEILEDGVAGILLIDEDNVSSKGTKLRDFEKSFYDIMLGEMGDLGAFIKRVGTYHNGT